MILRKLGKGKYVICRDRIRGIDKSRITIWGEPKVFLIKSIGDDIAYSMPIKMTLPREFIGKRVVFFVKVLGEDDKND